MDQKPVFIISGAQGEGKTTLLNEVISILQKKDIYMAGFCAEGSWKNGQRYGFQLIDIVSGEKKICCTSDFEEGFEQLGRFYFDMNTIQWGEELLETGVETSASLFVIDEMGKFELKGKVWHNKFISLLNSQKPLLVTVRTSLLKQFIDFYGIQNSEVFSMGQDVKEIAEKIIQALK